MAIRKRKDVLKLSTWDPALVWYAKAIADMQSRGFVDSSSWRYQAAIHDYDPQNDPLDVPTDPPPPIAEQDRFWRRCQHASWFFLPWHRMYLAYFEQIVATTVASLGGPADWALPYWNYSDAGNPDARKLPPAFIAPALPDGSPNALMVANRLRGNDGKDVASNLHVDLSVCLAEPDFEGNPGGGIPGFGGPRTAFHHPGTGFPIGSLEATPHGSMHVRVGGWMGRFNTAGLDPVFWLHHCNIDRLWEVWRKRDARRQDPSAAAWTTNVTFDFHDASGQVVSLRPSQVVSTTAAPLFYEYEDISDPLGAQHPSMESARVRGMADRPIPEMVGATEAPHTLAGGSTTIRFTATPPTGPASRAESVDAPRRIVLNIENVTAPRQTTGYEVYLNLPAGSDPVERQDHLAGHLSMFGVDSHSTPDDKHSGDGLHYALDVTRVVRVLESRNAWNPRDISVTFVPEDVPPSDRESAAEKVPVQVGRISLYMA